MDGTVYGVDYYLRKCERGVIGANERVSNHARGRLNESLPELTIARLQLSHIELRDRMSNAHERLRQR